MGNPKSSKLEDEVIPQPVVSIHESPDDEDPESEAVTVRPGSVWKGRKITNSEVREVIKDKK